MSSDRSFERNARAWLELGPTDPPARVVEDVLLAIEMTPQERVLRIPWRRPHMTFFNRLATAAVLGVLVAGGGILYLRGQAPQTGLQHPSPTTASPSATAVPASGRLPGWLVFLRGSGIWLVKADGSGLHELAAGLGPKTSFDVSPDGLTIAFTVGQAPVDQAPPGCSVDPCPGSQIWEAQTDGQGAPSLLIPGCGYDHGCSVSDPAFSPDGLRVAFAERDGLVYDGNDSTVIGYYDSVQARVTYIEGSRNSLPSSDPVQAVSSHPAWSPDGQRIAYLQRIRDFGFTVPGTYETSRIAVINLDGTGLHRLPVRTALENAGPPSWSPKDLILFSTAVSTSGVPTGSLGPLLTVRPDGSALTALCASGLCLGPGGDGAFPTWMADGRVLYWQGVTWAVLDLEAGEGFVVNRYDMTGPLPNAAPGMARLVAIP